MFWVLGTILFDLQKRHGPIPRKKKKGAKAGRQDARAPAPFFEDPGIGQNMPFFLELNPGK